MEYDDSLVCQKKGVWCKLDKSNYVQIYTYSQR
jgi:hypothetical protein